MDIRPAHTNSLKLVLNNNTVLNIKSSKHVTDSLSNCKFVKYENTTTTYASRVVKLESHNKPLDRKFEIANTLCEKTNKAHGQCNMFSMAQYWIPMQVPFPLKTLHRNFDELN